MYWILGSIKAGDRLPASIVALYLFPEVFVFDTTLFSNLLPGSLQNALEFWRIGQDHTLYLIFIFKRNQHRGGYRGRSCGACLAGLKLEKRQFLFRYPGFNPQEFDPDDATFLIKIKDYARPYLFRFDYRALVQSKVKRIALLVNLKSHFLSLILRSKKAVTALFG